MANAHVVALAARTPVGADAEGTAAAVRAGISRVADHPFFVDAWGEPVRCGRDALIDPALVCVERMAALAGAALREIDAKLRPQAQLPKIFTVLVALPEPRPGFDGNAARLLLAQIAAQPGCGPDRFSLRAVGQGHAGALSGMQQALARLAQDQVCIVGGIDSYLDGPTLDWLEEEGRLACGPSRTGFPPGEGAAFLALASDAFRKQARLPWLASVRGVACTTETRDPYSAESLQGEALSAAIAQVAALLRRGQERFDDCYCDVNDERVRMFDIAFTVLRTGQWFRDSSAYVTPVGSIGDVGAASAALGAVLAVRAWERDYASGDNALVHGASWTGARGALLLQRPEVRT